MNVRFTTGQELKVGDTMNVLGHERRITGFAPYNRLASFLRASEREPGRVAEYDTEEHGTQGIAVLDSDLFAVVNGVWRPRHAWRGEAFEN